MIPNLVHYSSHSLKINPAELEMNKTPPPFKIWKLLSSILIDFYVIAMAASFMTFVFQAAVTPFMPTSYMRHSLMMVDMNALSFSILPFVTLGYFFFCFFMNEGQTLGMKKLKLRISGTKYDYRNAFLWSARAVSVVFTCGISAFLLKDHFSASCLVDDHLYQYLMLQKEWTAPSLVERTTPKNEDVIQEDYAQAA